MSHTVKIPAHRKFVSKKIIIIKIFIANKRAESIAHITLSLGDIAGLVLYFEITSCAPGYHQKGGMKLPKGRDIKRQYARMNFDMNKKIIIIQQQQ